MAWGGGGGSEKKEDGINKERDAKGIGVSHVCIYRKPSASRCVVKVAIGPRSNPT
jgi:hypothetical protein